MGEKKNLTIRQMKEAMVAGVTGKDARQYGDERPWEALSPKEQQECEEAAEAMKTALLGEGGMQLLVSCGHCKGDWLPGDDEELVSCEVAAEPGHLVCWECREEQVECPEKRPQ